MTSPDAVPDSVRLALPREASGIAEIQARAWKAEFADSPQLVSGLDVTEMAALWEQSIRRPPLAVCRVLVAVDQAGVHGFAVTMPSDDPDATAGADGAIAEFVIDPPMREKGHGSRLLNACVDTLRADGFTRATWWVRSDDDELRAFLTESGWAADGSHREIGLVDESVRFKQVRLHTDISG